MNTWHAHYCTAVAEQADGEYTDATAITSNDEATYERTGSRGDLIAFVPHDRAHEEHARLIAAAPDILAALESCHDYIMAEFERLGPSAPDSMDELADKIEAALKRAKGDV